VVSGDANAEKRSGTVRLRLRRCHGKEFRYVE
jgi:hypothetical protein